MDVLRNNCIVQKSGNTRNGKGGKGKRSSRDHNEMENKMISSFYEVNEIDTPKEGDRNRLLSSMHECVT